MLLFDVDHLFPRFLLEDKTGYAMAKALEKGLEIFCRTVQDGVDIVLNVEKMPEWRLDEMAWEYNIPYDYTASIEVKREWIRNVYSLSRLYGTPEGITQYMSAYFDKAILQEAREYGGEPYHFRMVFPDSWTPEKVSWATTAIQTVKNVRSVLDAYKFKSEWRHDLYAGCALYSREQGRFRIAAIETGEMNWYVDEWSDMLLDEDGMLLIVEG